MRFRKRPVEVEATQWFKNGDHPADNVFRPFEDTGLTPPEPREGKVVRYYRRPESEFGGKRVCPHCGKTMHVHGWIDTLEGGHYPVKDMNGEAPPSQLSITTELGNNMLYVSYQGELSLSIDWAQNHQEQMEANPLWPLQFHYWLSYRVKGASLRVTKGSGFMGRVMSALAICVYKVALRAGISPAVWE